MIVTLLFFIHLAHALTFPVSIHRRGGNITPLTNTADVSYYANLTLNGDPFYCLIDTGSSDLWVAGSVNHAKDTGKSTGVTYAIDSVQGDIKTANLSFAGYTISDQAFIQVTADDKNPKGKGLIGLGPNTGSNVYKTLNNDGARSVANRIFLQNTSTPNFITVNLGRIEDPDDPFPGNITIGETLSGLDSILSQPKIPVTQVSVHRSGDQHFQILIDADGIIGPDNQSISFTTSVDETSSPKQPTAVIDTGFSLSQVPKIVADKFYSRFDGAEYVNVNGIGNTWIVPCTTEVNMTWMMQGVRYPIHPLDATLKPSIMGMDDGAVRNSKGEDCCIGMFQPMSFDRGDDPTYDIILGMSFLRNVYALFDYGDFISGSSTDRGDPYLQLLSTTDIPSSHLDFVKVRLGGVDTTSSQVLNDFDASLEDSSSNNNNNNNNNKNKYLKTVFLALAITAGVLGVALLVWGCCCRRRGTKARQPQGGKAYKPNAGWMEYGGYGRLGGAGGSASAGGAYPFQGISNSNSSATPYTPGGDTRYNSIPVHDHDHDVSPNYNYEPHANANYAGVGLGRGEAPPYSPSAFDHDLGTGTGTGAGFYDPPPQTYNPRATSPSPGGYTNPWEGRR